MCLTIGIFMQIGTSIGLHRGVGVWVSRRCSTHIFPLGALGDVIKCAASQTEGYCCSERGERMERGEDFLLRHHHDNSTERNPRNL